MINIIVKYSIPNHREILLVYTPDWPVLRSMYIYFYLTVLLLASLCTQICAYQIDRKKTR